MGTNSAGSLSERVQKSFQQLAVRAANLNTVSDELGKSIEELDAALKKLNLGVTAWVTFARGGDESGEYWSTRELGYSKISNRWGIALRTCSGEYSYPERDSEETWPFNDAPRWMRIEGINHIPELIDELGEEAEKTTQRIREKVGEAQQLAATINAVAQPQSKKK